jgi:hypothetical protein
MPKSKNAQLAETEKQEKSVETPPNPAIFPGAIVEVPPENKPVSIIQDGHLDPERLNAYFQTIEERMKQFESGFQKLGEFFNQVNQAKIQQANATPETLPADNGGAGMLQMLGHKHRKVA